MFSRLSSLCLSFLTAVAAVVGVFALLSPVEAADLIVNPGESIQAAIDAAAAGDTIIIQPGTYTESPPALGRSSIPRMLWISFVK